MHLEGCGPITVIPSTAELWSDLDRTELTSGQILSVFAYTTTWDYQERHPSGDELVVVLEGRFDVLLELGDGLAETAIPLSGRGSCRVIPAGTWHRLAVNEPGTVLFVTPVPARTEHRKL